jgi:hypothetical protein
MNTYCIKKSFTVRADFHEKLKRLIGLKTSSYDLNTLNTPLIINSTLTVIMARLAYVDDVLVCCRLRGIYSAMRNENYRRAKVLLNDMLANMRRADICMTKHEYSTTMDAFYNALGHLAMKRYNNAHDNIRDLFYSLKKSYISV